MTDFQSCYHHPEPNQSIFLSKTTASITAEDIVSEIDAEITLQLLPNARIEIRASYPKRLTPHYLLGNPIDIKHIPGFCVRMNAKGTDTKFVWRPKHEPVIGIGDPNTKLKHVIFHIFNFSEIIGTRRTKEKSGKSIFAIEHVNFEDSDWAIEIKSLVSTSNVFEALKEKGGYGLTHIGFLSRKNNTSFTGREAENYLSALNYFLSFSKGMWCHPCLAVGFNNKGRKKAKVWEAWSSPRGQWADPLSWFDPHHCGQISSLFPGFMDKWKNEEWQKALREVIYWYLSSNCSTLGRGIGIDAGIILTQAAIERLSFEYAVRSRKLIGVEGFKNLKASDKFRLLFSSLNIPINIPRSLKDLQNLSQKNKWHDAPHALTEVRNTLVHPEHKRRGQFDQAFFSTWNLSQWYLELAILRICNYSGTYSNRLTQGYVGQVEDVPWDNVVF